MQKGFLMANRVAVVLMALIFLLGTSGSSLAGTPTIKFTYVSPYGNANGIAKGLVSPGPFDYYVAVYIQVDEVWWTKPYANQVKTPINSDGSFLTDITTGGCDLYATAVFAQLMPKNTTPKLCTPCQKRPNNSSAVASATKYRPYPRALNFSGYPWRVKRATACTLGPGPNYFSDTNKDVWVDTNGFLHLRIRKVAPETWYSSEVVLNQSLGYGTYVFRTRSRIDLLDPNITLGMFTWDTRSYHPTHREMDIEVARWGNPDNPTNAQFAVQPCDQCPGCANCSRFQIDLTDQNKIVTFYMTWSPGKAEFCAYRGRYGLTPPAVTPIHCWSKTDGIPVPGKENIRINFWLFRGAAPLNGKNAEVIFEKFLFQPQP